uniref:Uncharacterized protein n=1 Tax=Sphaerodactylus townsendi TaxID=933632 RepID=A0ACB8GAS2_9SAUR
MHPCLDVQRLRHWSPCRASCLTPSKTPNSDAAQYPSKMLPGASGFMDELPDSVTRWAPPGISCGEIATFLEKVSNLAYNETPQYEMLKKILLSGLEHRGRCYDPFNFTTVTSTLTEHTSNPKKTDLPKPTPKPGKEAKEIKQENKGLPYQRKAIVRRQDEQLQAQVSKPLQSQVNICTGKAFPLTLPVYAVTVGLDLKYANEMQLYFTQHTPCSAFYFNMEKNQLWLTYRSFHDMEHI